MQLRDPASANTGVYNRGSLLTSTPDFNVAFTHIVLTHSIYLFTQIDTNYTHIHNEEERLGKMRGPLGDTSKVFTLGNSKPNVNLYTHRGISDYKSTLIINLLSSCPWVIVRLFRSRG